MQLYIIYQKEDSWTPLYWNGYAHTAFIDDAKKFNYLDAIEAIKNLREEDNKKRRSTKNTQNYVLVKV